MLSLRVSRRPSIGSAALAGYLLIAFVYFGLPLLLKPGSQYVGQGQDPPIFIWAFAWWPHAILHGQNPFVSDAVWAPSGFNLMWATMVPGLALAFSPLTLVAGPIAAYNVASILLPALAAWTAFALCRYLTHRVWPSLVGGYLFGFSSYSVLHAGLGHLNLTSVFLLPLVGLVVLRFLNRQLSGVQLVVRLGPLLAFQLLLSTEVLFTQSLALVAGLLAGFAFFRDRRARIVSLVPYAISSYVVAAALTEPFVYYLVVGQRVVINPGTYAADVVNFVVPTNFSLVASDAASALTHDFANITIGQEAYLGLPALIVIGLLLWERRRSPVGRFFVVAFVATLLAPLGEQLSVLGRRVMPLPWDLVQSLPLLDNTQPVRFAVYASLVTAVGVAIWTAGRRQGELRTVLPALAVIAVAANPIAGAWASDTNVPPFFTNPTYRSCLDPGETVLPLPISRGSVMLWQAEDDFRFNMAGGYVGPYGPRSFTTPEFEVIADGSHLDSAQTNVVRDFVAAKGVTAVVVDQGEAPFFSGALDGLATPETVGGVVLYRIRGASSC